MSNDQAGLAELREQLREAQETIEAIRGGGVDSLIIGAPGHEQVYTLTNVDRPYQLIVKAMNEGALTVSPRGVILDANPRLGVMVGQAAAQLVGTPVINLIPSAHRPGFTRLLDIGAGDSARGEVDLTGPGGMAVPVLLAVSGFDLDGMFLRCLVLTDLTAQRAVEAEAATAREALSETDMQLRALFDHAPIGIGINSLTGTLERGNARLYQILGYTADEMRSLSTRDITFPEDRAGDEASMQSLVSGGTDSYSREKRYLQKDGSTVWVEASRTLVRHPDGNPMMIVGTARDITAQRHAEAEVRTLNAELETRVERRTADLAQANENMEAFIYSVAHDLRAPLRGLNGYSELLLEDCGDSLGETGRGYAGRIQAASERLGALIDALLHLSRVSRASTSPELVDLSAEAAAIAADLQSSEPGRRVRTVIEAGVQVTADRVLIHTVLQNLLENAWKFTSQRDGATVEFGASTSSDGVACYYVRDNGAGFDQAYEGKLFKPFQRLHAAGEFPGTGIGLASVQRIIEHHGGRVWAHGAVGEGATFYFTLSPKESP